MCCLALIIIGSLLHGNLEQLYFFIFQILSFHLTSFVVIYLSLTIAADRGTLKKLYETIRRQESHAKLSQDGRFFAKPLC